MMFHRHRKVSPIGIDIGRRFIKAAQIERQGATEVMRAHAILERLQDGLTFGLEEALRLREVLLRRGFSGDRVILAAPTDKTACEMFDLPPRASSAPIEQIARAELARTAKFGEASFEMGLWDLPASARANTGTNVLAVGLREDDAEALLASFDDARLNVRAIDVSIAALARACVRHRGDESSTQAVLDIGWEGCTLLLSTGNLVLYQRRLAESGLGLLCREISSRWSLTNEAAELLISETPDHASAAPQPGTRWQWITDQIKQFAEGLGGEVRASLTYMEHRYADRPVGKLWVTGGGANLVGLCTALQGQINLPAGAVTYADVGLGAVPNRETGDVARLAIALGLARWEGTA